MMNCEQATRLMSEGEERPLSVSERTTLHMHTWFCTGCRNVKGQLGFIRHAMKSCAQGPEMEGGVNDDIRPPSSPL